MKKIFGTIAAVAGFSTLASLILFFVMSPESLGNIPIPKLSGARNLTADIGGIFSGGTPSEEPATSQATALPQAAEAAASPSATAATTTSAPAAASAPQTPLPENAPAPAPIPAPQDAAPQPPEPPVASATVTVTPATPAPSLPLSAQTAPSPAPAPAGTAVLFLPYSRSDFSDVAEWQATWGVLGTTSEGYLSLGASPNSFGGAVYLKGGAGWNGYTMDATVSLRGGQEFGLAADYADASNYVMCDYTKTGTNAFTMQLVQYSHGYRIPLTLAVPVAADASADLDASIQTSGIYGSCSLGPDVITNQGIGPGRAGMASAGSGSVGFMVNDPVAGTSRLIVKNVSVR